MKRPWYKRKIKNSAPESDFVDDSAQLMKLLFDATRAGYAGRDRKLADLLFACAIPSYINTDVVGILRDMVQVPETNDFSGTAAVSATATESIAATDAEIFDRISRFSFVERLSPSACVYRESLRSALLLEWQSQTRKEKFEHCSERVVHYYKRMGLHHYYAREFNDALLYFDHAREMAPGDDLDSCEALFESWIGRTHMILRDYEAAERFFTRVIDKRPDGYRNLKGRGMARFHLQNYDAACKDLEQVVEHRKWDANALYALALSYIELQQYRQADHILTHWLELMPSDHFGYYGRALSRYYRGRPTAALEDLNRAVQGDPENLNYLALRGRLFADLEKYDLAIMDFTTAIHLSADDVEYYYGRALVHYRMQSYHLAKTDFDMVIQSTPAHPMSRYWRALALYFLRDFEMAASDLTAFIHAEPENDRGYYFRGLCNLLLEKKTRARQDLRQSLQLAGSEPHTPFWLGAIYWLDRDEDKASKYWQTALDLITPDSVDYHRIMAKICLLKGSAVKEAQSHYSESLLSVSHDGSAKSKLQLEASYLNNIAALCPRSREISEVSRWYHELIAELSAQKDSQHPQSQYHNERASGKDQVLA